MTNGSNKNADVNKPEEGDAKPATGKKKLLMRIILGVAGLIAVLAIAFVTLMIVGKGGSSSSSSSQKMETAEKGSRQGGGRAASAHNTLSTYEDSILALAENDQSVLDKLMKSLEVLDYVPTDDEVEDETVGMSAEDSIEIVNWLDKEKAALAAKKAKLDAREKELNVLDGRVTQKLLRLEQAESARTTQLAKLYDGMDASAVARLAANLDDETVVAILPRMKLKNASLALSLMPAARAARLSKQMITIAEQ
jgi:hypothetical protein